MAVVGKRRKTTRRRVSGTAAVGRRRRRSTTHHRPPARRRRAVSGTSAVGRTHRRRRSVSGTGAKGLMKQVVPMAVGMAAGVAVQHFALRPLEAKIAQKAPMAAKFFAIGEILLGGYVALKAKHPIVKGIGLGIMAGGVQTGVKQLNLYHESPAVQGVGDYTTVRIPVNGQVREMLSGIVRNQNGDTYTSMVAGSDYDGVGDYEMSGRISDDRLRRTNLLAGIYGLDDAMGEVEQDNYLPPKGMF